ncbi:MAG TPA: hypothetical protein VGH55_06280, partial [Chthoniobacterales bacterium]
LRSLRAKKTSPHRSGKKNALSLEPIASSWPIIIAESKIRNEAVADARGLPHVPVLAASALTTLRK